MALEAFMEDANMGKKEAKFDIQMRAYAKDERWGT